MVNSFAEYLLVCQIQPDCNLPATGLQLEEVLKKYASLDMFAGYQISSPISPGPDGDTPFHIAAYDGDLDSVRTMIPFVVDINLQGDIGNTPLHYAISNRKLAMVEELLSYGADISKKTIMVTHP